MKSMGYIAYKKSETQFTENKGKILSLLYEGAIRFTRFAIMGMEKEDPRIKGENISKVLAILTELDCALDRDQEKDLADNLNGLYQYMMRRLTYANFNNEKKALVEVDRLLSELKDAFDRAVDSISKDLAEKPETSPPKKSSDKVSLAV
ncbi:Flagellar protein FliS [Candidatus Magnetomorum sp. HK-1]|nr:Flagellar protein FliS [Candidatus Magnetomorum sp. HK-1]